MKNPLEQGHGTQSNPLGYERLVAIGKPILDKSSKCQKRSTTQILTRSDPKIRGQDPKTLSKRAHNSWTYAHLTPATLGIAMLFLSM